MAMQDTSVYDRTVPMGTPAGFVGSAKRRDNRRGFRIKPGWVVIAALAIGIPTMANDDATVPLAVADADLGAADTHSHKAAGTHHDHDDDHGHGIADDGDPIEREHVETKGKKGHVDLDDTPAPPDLALPAVVLPSSRPVAPGKGPGAKRVLIIGIDGVRPDALKKAKTPNMDAIARVGAYNYDARSGEVTLSGPCWTSMLTGVIRQRHGITTNRITDISKLATWPTLFHRYHQKYPRMTKASIVGWRPLNSKILTDAPINVKESGGDRTITKKSVDLLNSDPNLGLLFVHLDNVDSAGHEYGHHPSARGYLRAIWQADYRIGKILEALNARADRDEWLIVVTTDHGGSKDGSHGRSIEAHRRIFMMMSGPDVIPGEIAGQPSIMDIAASVVEHLKLPSLDRGRALDGVALALPDAK